MNQAFLDELEKISGVRGALAVAGLGATVAGGATHLYGRPESRQDRLLQALGRMHPDDVKHRKSGRDVNALAAGLTGAGLSTLAAHKGARALSRLSEKAFRELFEVARTRLPAEVERYSWAAGRNFRKGMTPFSKKP